MQVTITAIKRTPRISKRTGKPFTSLGIKTQEHGEQWLSGFGNDDNADWEVGHKVEVEVEKKDEYLNFKTPQKDKSPAMKDGAAAEIVNLLNFKVDAKLDKVLEALQMMSEEIISIGKKLSADDYPPFDETNDAHGL